MIKCHFYFFFSIPIDFDSSLFDDSFNPTETSRPCRIICDPTNLCHGNRQDNQNLLVIFYWLTFIIATNLFSNAISLGGLIGFNVLPRAELFGKQRIWGTVGFGLSAFCSSLLYRRFSTERVYIIIFIILTSLCILVTSLIRITIRKSTNTNNGMINEGEMTDFNASSLPIETVDERNISQTNSFKYRHLLTLLKRIDVLIFLSLTFIWGMSDAGLDPVS